MTIPRPLLLVCVGVLMHGCSTPHAPEIETAAPPGVPQSWPVDLIERHISGQVFWQTEGGDTVEGSGAQILIYDRDYLARVSEVIENYSRQEFDQTNSFYAGAPGRIMRAKTRMHENIDTAWNSMSPPIAVIVADSEGRFEHRGMLPTKIGVYCFVRKKTPQFAERIRWALLQEQFTSDRWMLLTEFNRQK
jgi:hypothetical protein